MRISRPNPGDVLLVAALLLAAVVDIALGATDGVGWATNGEVWLIVLVTAVSIVPLAWRRTSPAVAAGATVFALLVPAALGAQADSLTLLVAHLLAIHAVNAYGSRRVALAGSLSILAAVVVSLESAPDRVAGDLIWTLVFFGMAAASGQAMAAHTRTTTRLQAEAERAAIGAERRAVAADLHDIVAHGVALMVVQAGGASSLIERDPGRAREMLDQVQAAGARTALELDHLLQALSPDRNALTQIPGLADLPGLVERVREGGTSVRLLMDGDLAHVPAGVGTSAYRVVQESLTNALKHSACDEVSVTVEANQSNLNVEVIDRVTTRAGSSTPWEPRPNPGPGGFGLLAMRERVAVFGGSVTSGPTAEGWTVQATFPLAAAPAVLG